jgi:hypothetical protein
MLTLLLRSSFPFDLIADAGLPFTLTVFPALLVLAIVVSYTLTSILAAALQLHSQ